MAKQFPLGQILSITTGRLVCPIEGVYEILNYMTSDSLFTHQLPRAGRECEPHLLRQHPSLNEIKDAPGLDEVLAGLNGPDLMVACKKWVAQMAVKYGESLYVEPIPRDDHDVKDPIAEMIEMVGPDKVIAVKTE